MEPAASVHEHVFLSAPLASSPTSISNPKLPCNTLNGKLRQAEGGRCEGLEYACTFPWLDSRGSHLGVFPEGCFLQLQSATFATLKSSCQHPKPTPLNPFTSLDNHLPRPKTPKTRKNSQTLKALNPYPQLETCFAEITPPLCRPRSALLPEFCSCVELQRVCGSFFGFDCSLL